MQRRKGVRGEILQCNSQSVAIPNAQSFYKSIRKRRITSHKLDQGYEDLQKRKSKWSTNTERCSVAEVVRKMQIKAINYYRPSH